MDVKTLGDMADNPAVSDDTLFDALQEFVADKKDGTGNVIPLSIGEMVDFERMRDRLREKRPHVLERLRKKVMADHHSCCDHGAGDEKCSS